MNWLDRVLAAVGLRRVKSGLPLTGRANYCPVCGHPLELADPSKAVSERGRDGLRRTGRCPTHGWIEVGWKNLGG